MFLKNKTAIITGSNRGIGKAILNVFAQNECDIVACSRKEDEHFTRECQTISERYQVDITPIYFDISNESDVKEAVKALAHTKKNIDILVNNAGIAHGGLFQMSPIKDIRHVFDINYFGLVAFSQGITRIMAKNRKGTVINIASSSGIDSRAGNVAYGASKSALISLTKTMACEIANYGIRVNAIAPGLIDTDMLTKMEHTAKQKLIEANLFHRLGTPEEVANVALFLASDLSSYITGQVIRVDGGMI